MKAKLRAVGRRGATLLLLAFVSGVLSFGLFTAPPDTYLGPKHVMPLDIWGVAWAVLGVVLVGFAFTSRDRLAFGIAAAAFAAWSTSYVVGALLENPRLWVSFATWAVFSAWVLMVAGWHENAE